MSYDDNIWDEGTFGCNSHPEKIWSTNEAYYFKRALKGGFLIFSPNIFLAFNSRDIAMLWVCNLFSRSSPTKLWKRIFEKMSKKIFLTLKVDKWWDLLILTPWERSNFGQKFRWKLFFKNLFLCSLNQCIHVLNHPKTVKKFYSRVSISSKHLNRLPIGWDFFKDLWKMPNLGQKFRWKLFLIKIFSDSLLQSKHV